MVARGLIAASLLIFGASIVGCGKGKSAVADAGVDAGHPAGSAVAQGIPKKKVKVPRDPNAPPRPPVKHPDFPGTAEGIKGLAAQFVLPNADQRALASALRPDLEDYEAVFLPDVAIRLRDELEDVWDEPGRKVSIPLSRNVIKVWQATTDELLAGKGENPACVDAYKGVAKMLKPGIVVYCLKFQKPDDVMGSAYDGLIYVRGHWAIFPRPEKILQHVEEEAAKAAEEKAEKEAKEKAAPPK